MGKPEMENNIQVCTPGYVYVAAGLPRLPRCVAGESRAYSMQHRKIPQLGLYNCSTGTVRESNVLSELYGKSNVLSRYLSRVIAAAVLHRSGFWSSTSSRRPDALLTLSVAIPGEMGDR